MSEKNYQTETLTSLAAKFNVTTKTLYKFLKKNYPGWFLRGNRKRIYFPKEVARIERDYVNLED